MQFMVSQRKDIVQAVYAVIDPELRISIGELGLLYNIIPHGENWVIELTLTSIGCPLYPIIEQELWSNLQDKGFTREQVTIEVTFDPPWELSMMSEEAKAKMGIE